MREKFAGCKGECSFEFFDDYFVLDNQNDKHINYSSITKMCYDDQRDWIVPKRPNEAHYKIYFIYDNVSYFERLSYDKQNSNDEERFLACFKYIEEYVKAYHPDYNKDLPSILNPGNYRIWPRKKIVEQPKPQSSNRQQQIPQRKRKKWWIWLIVIVAILQTIFIFLPFFIF